MSLRPTTQHLALIATTLALLAPALATADPGAIDPSFSRDGVVALPLASDVRQIWPSTGGSVRWLQRAIPGEPWLGGATPTGRLVAFSGTGLVADSDNPVTWAYPQPHGTFVAGGQWGYGGFTTTVFSRWTRSGRRIVEALPHVEPNYNGADQLAVARDGRLLFARPTDGERTTLQWLLPDGHPDAAVAARALPGVLVDRVAIDPGGRVLLAVTAVPGYTYALRRLRADLSDDPSFPSVPLASRAVDLLVSPHGTTAVATLAADAPSRALVDLAVPEPRALPTAPAAQLDRASTVAYDRQDRLVLADGSRLVRLSADGARFRVLRASLPAGATASALAVDAAGRILVGGSRPSPNAATDVTPRETDGVVLRLEGGDRRVVIFASRIGRPIVVRCLPNAERRCLGVVTVRHGQRVVARHVLRLAAGRRTTVALPAAVVRGTARVTVDVRVRDGTGELASATRVVRR